MLATNPLYITPDDYLAAEEISPIRHEYRDGEVFAMIDSTRNHHTIIGNLFYQLKNHLHHSNGRIFSSGMKLRLDSIDAFYYPDVVVTCDDRDRPNNEQYINHPSLIIEVLSPSTARFDRTEKFADYRTIPSLSEYVLVSTDGRQIEQFQRDDRGQWHKLEFDDSLQLASVDCAIAIDEIYEDTDILA
jgi:Uma2 family endonuclease